MRLGPDLGARQLLDVTEATVRKDIPTTQYKLAKLLKVDSVAGPIIAQHGRQPGTLIIDDGDLADWPHRAIVRIHGTLGPNALPWHELRRFGPTANRFDPSPPPTRTHPDFAVSYSAATLDTALAEVFQRGRIIAPSAPNSFYLTIWEPRRRLRLLDLRGTWPITGPAQRIGYAVT